MDHFKKCVLLCTLLFPRGPEEVRTLNQIITVPGVKAMSNKHVRYDIFTAFPGYGKKYVCDIAHAHNAEEI